MKSKDDFSKLASDERIDRTIAALKESGIEACCVESAEEAREKVLSLIPEGSEVFTMSSVTLAETGISKAIDESSRYNSVRNKLNSMDKNEEKREMVRLGSAPDYALGSVHAVTEDGKVIIASNTGSQLPAYVYGSRRVIWVVGTQKIVRNLDEGLRRIYHYVLPLESKRINKAYNISTGSNVSKLLIVNKEIQPGRITIVFVKEKLGF